MSETAITEKPKLIRLQIAISPPADHLLRQHFHHKGDLSKIIEGWIWEHFGAEAVQKPVQVTT